MIRPPKAVRLVALAATLAILLACGPGAGNGEQGGANPAATTAAKPSPKKDPLADMVSAVSGGRASGTVELKFALDERPQVGEPLEVEIAVLPVSVLDRVAVHFQVGAGLELRSGGEMPAVNKPERGVPLSHRLTIVPLRDGIFFISAVVLADSPEQSLTRTFSIPIISGQGLPQQAEGGVAAPPRGEAETP
ncbi:MAG: hypothetical protein ACT4O5_10110 [Gammaproteobacteria bacterium]